MVSFRGQAEEPEPAQTGELRLARTHVRERQEPHKARGQIRPETMTFNHPAGTIVHRSTGVPQPGQSGQVRLSVAPNNCERRYAGVLPVGV